MDKPPLAKKSLGQHWLQDETVLTSIADEAQVSVADTVLEIGPGPGSLTRVLSTRARQVIAVELDRRWADRLVTQHLPNVQVVAQDILKFDLTSLPSGYKVVANIPYYLSGNLLRLLGESPNPFSRAVILVQREVAERTAAGPGNMSLLSISVQLYSEVSLGQLVPAELFTPPPKVDSQVLILQRRQRPLFEVDPRLFFRIAAAGFAQRRKTLANSLSGGLRIERLKVVQILENCGTSPSIRPQMLSLWQWHQLYQAITPLLSH